MKKTAIAHVPGPRIRMLVALTLVLAGCAADQATNNTVRNNDELRLKGDLEGALTQAEANLRTNPDDVRLRTEHSHLLTLYTNKTLQEADQALKSGDEAAAVARLTALTRHDPGNARAEQGLEQIKLRVLHRSWLTQAQALAAQDPASALDWLLKILAEEPDWQEAITLRDRLLRENAMSVMGPTLPPALKQTVALSFRNQSLTTIFDAISRMTGINFIFDRDVSPALSGTIETKNASAWDAINLLLATNQLAKQILNGNTLLIYPARPDKAREYQDQSVRVFYLSNADPKQVYTTLKQVLKPRELAIDERLNAIIMRDDPALLAAAERVVQSLDLPQSEVTLDVEILEVSATLGREMGIAYPDSIGIGFVPASGATPADSKADANSTGISGQIGLGDLSSNRIGLNFGTRALGINLNQKNSQVKTLANPRIRVKNREKAKIVIGEKVPVISTTTGSSGNFAGESVSYEEVGLTLEVQPSISLGQEISVKIKLTVSDIVDRLITSNKNTVYVLGNRSAETVLSTRDNVTQVLGGLIKNSGNETRSGLPYLSQIPLLDSLFGTHGNIEDDTEIVLLITPHIARQFTAPPSALTRFEMGPETRAGDPLELRENTGVLSAVPGQPAAARDIPPAPPLPPLPPDMDPNSQQSPVTGRRP